MDILIIYILFISIFHFIYEGTIAPSVRWHLRCRLSMLKNELCLVKLEQKEKLKDEICKDLEWLLNAAIDRLSRIDVPMLYNMNRTFIQDENLRRQIEKKDGYINSLVNNCQISEVSRIQRDIHRIFGYALLTNSGGWLVYVFPILLLLPLIDKFIEIIPNKNKIKTLIRNTLIISQPLFDGISPLTMTLAVS